MEMGNDVTAQARETVGELIERVGEKEAYLQIVTDSIRYRTLLFGAVRSLQEAVDNHDMGAVNKTLTWIKGAIGAE